MSATPLHDPTAAPLADSVTETRNTTCHMWVWRCGIHVHLRNGEVRSIEGNLEHPQNQGVICAKGSSDITKQYSPARLTKPLRRKIRATAPPAIRPVHRSRPYAGPERPVRSTVRQAQPCGRGGFGSVNMGAGMTYSIGGSFWEFDGPDLEGAKLFEMTGAAGEHHSNPLKTVVGMKRPRAVQKAWGFVGGSFNTREFFHGRSAASQRSVKWGLLLERWFFFAQANHPQSLYDQTIS